LAFEDWKKLLARHNELTREAIERAGGEVIKSMGDGFFAAFEGPKAAVEAAVAVQRALNGEVYAPDVRIGCTPAGLFIPALMLQITAGRGCTRRRGLHRLRAPGRSWLATRRLM